MLRCSYRMIAFVCLGLSLASCSAKEPARVHTVRQLAEARWEAPPLTLGTLTVKADVRWTIEGAYVRDLACLEMCNSVLSLELPGIRDPRTKPSDRERAFDQVLDRASKNGLPSPCMVLRVKPRTGRSTNPNLLGGRYSIGWLEFVDVVDEPCLLNPGDRPLGSPPPQPR